MAPYAIAEAETDARIGSPARARALVGLALAFVHYTDELPYFGQEVLPRLERMGVRIAVERSRMASDGESA